MIQDSYFINKKVFRILFWIVVCAVVLIVISNLIPKKLYHTCAELKKDGYANIKSGSLQYNAALDRNHDQIACNA